MNNGVTSIQMRIANLKRLARMYFELEHGVQIDKYHEELRVFDIRGSMHTEHPHQSARIYITRRALKHVVESRKAELSKTHTNEQALDMLSFALEHLQDTITNFDKYELIPPTHSYTKDFPLSGKPPMRILLEKVSEKKLLIKSVHFTKRRSQ